MFLRLRKVVVASMFLAASAQVVAGDFQTTGSEMADSEVKSQLESTNTACGSNIGFSGDRTAWKKAKGKSASHCAVALSGIQDWCSNKYDEVGKQDDIKKFVKAKIKTVKCSYTDKSGGRSMKLSRGTLTYTADSDMAINDGFVVGYLESQLDPETDAAPVKSKKKK